jgi:hypothetical protein
MIDRQTLRQLCEYDYRPSLVGSAILDWTGLTAEERARLIWGIDEALEQRKEPDK